MNATIDSINDPAPLTEIEVMEMVTTLFEALKVVAAQQPLGAPVQAQEISNIQYFATDLIGPLTAAINSPT